MKRNTKKEWNKVLTQTEFNLYQSSTDPNAYQVRLRSSGGYLRRRLSAPNLSSTLEEVSKLLKGKQDEPSAEDSATFVEIFSQTLEFSRRNPKSYGIWLAYVERFLLWLKKNYPLCLQWKQLTRPIVREYVRSLEGLAPNTVRLYTQPIRQASLFAAQEFGWKDIAGGLGTCSKLKTLPCFVDVQDVADFLNFVQIEAPWMETGAALQGLAGLQLQEALRLTWDKVDLQKGLIEISGEVKNEYRNRVIPVCDRVLDSLKRSNRNQPKAEVVLSSNGQPYGDWKEYSRRLRSLLRRWNPEVTWAPKDLRNCLPTFGVRLGLHNTLWEQYIGHTPGTITGRHYVPRLNAPTKGERSNLDERMDLFRIQVIQPLEKALTRAHCGENLQLFATSPNTAENDERLGKHKALNQLML